MFYWSEILRDKFLAYVKYENWSENFFKKTVNHYIAKKVQILPNDYLDLFFGPQAIFMVKSSKKVFVLSQLLLFLEHAGAGKMELL